MMIKRRPVRQRRVSLLPTTYANRPKRIVGRQVSREQSNYIKLHERFDAFETKQKRDSRINRILIGVDWIIKLVLFWM